MKQIKGLDTLRAFAVFFVLIEHSGVWFDTSGPIGRFIKDVIIPDGQFGVFLFFVLSGFLITSILFNERIRIKNKGRGLVIRSFFIRRALRIFPIYYLMLLSLFIINYSDIRHNFIYYLTYTSNILIYQVNAWNGFSHTWTLSVEEQFYLLWPWFILFVNNKYLKYVFIVAIITGIVSSYIELEVNRHIAPLLVCNCFDAFGIGGIFAYLRLGGKWIKRIEKNIWIMGVISLGIYLFCKIAIFAGYPAFNKIYIFKTLNCILSIWLIMLVVNNKSERARKYFLENSSLNFIGKISYGIYLYHYVYITLVLSRLNDMLNKNTKSFPLINKIILDAHNNYWIQITIIVLISSLSYLVIEKPLLSLKRHFEYDRLGVQE